MSKHKPNKGLLKRVRISKKGKGKVVKFKNAGLGHLCSHKSGNRKRKLRKGATAHASDLERVMRLLKVK